MNGIHNLLPSRLPPIPKRALAYSPNITLSFVVLNEDASDGSYVDSWDINGALNDHVLPHLNALAPLWNFTIESQVLFHAPLTFEPTSVDDKWVLTEDEMKTFVSERWTLDSHSTNNPVLKFLLYIPSAKHRPLTLNVDCKLSAATANTSPLLPHPAIRLRRPPQPPTLNRSPAPNNRSPRRPLRPLHRPPLRSPRPPTPPSQTPPLPFA